MNNPHCDLPASYWELLEFYWAVFEGAESHVSRHMTMYTDFLERGPCEGIASKKE